jgi:hypothetical protein
VKQPVFKNPAIVDNVTYRKILEETNGRYGKANVEHIPEGRNIIYYHTALAEIFTVIEGIITPQEAVERYQKEHTK